MRKMYWDLKTNIYYLLILTSRIKRNIKTGKNQQLL